MKPLNRPMFRRGGRAGGGIMTGVQRQGYDGEDGKQIVEKNDMEKVAGNMESFNKAFPQWLFSYFTPFPNCLACRRAFRSCPSRHQCS